MDLTKSESSILEILLNAEVPLSKSMGKSNLKKANSVDIKSKLTLYFAIKVVFFLFAIIIIVAILNKIKLLKIEKMLTLKCPIVLFP